MSARQKLPGSGRCPTSAAPRQAGNAWIDDKASGGVRTPGDRFDSGNEAFGRGRQALIRSPFGSYSGSASTVSRMRSPKSSVS